MEPENAQLQERSAFSGHTQRCSDGSGWEQHPVPKQDDRFGAKHRRLLLWSVREHLIRVVQRSAFVSTGKLWLSRISFFGMDYSAALSEQKVACSIPKVGNFHTVGPCKKAVLACLATDVEQETFTFRTLNSMPNFVRCPAAGSRVSAQRERVRFNRHPEGTKLNSVQKVLYGKVRKFSPAKISSFTTFRNDFSVHPKLHFLTFARRSKITYT